jgi:NADPH-ferrihemoprotein reductase
LFTFLLLQQSKEEFERALNYKTMVQILRDFPSVQLNFEELLELTPALQCRYYSISSSPLVQPTTIDLTVVRHRFAAPFDRSLSMFGLCSSFLNAVQVGDMVRTFVKPTLFKLPENPAAHVIMIGAGTGLAPFRGFIQEREALRARNPAGQHGENILFFGCMDRKKDFIYGDSLMDWSARNVINFIPAYSHEQKELVFVQHRMMQNAEMMWKTINTPDAHIFVCGCVSLSLRDVCLCHVAQPSHDDGLLFGF